MRSRYKHLGRRGRLLTLLAFALIAASAMAVPAGAVPSQIGASSQQQPIPQTPRQGVEQFVGSWRLVSAEARTSDGQVSYPLGRDAGGLLIYTGDGYMSAAAWAPNRTPFAINDQQKGTPAEYTAAVQSYVQYTGRFEVNRDQGTVTHIIEQAVFPNWNGQSQPRFYSFDKKGDGLELTTAPFQYNGQTITAALVWQRIK